MKDGNPRDDAGSGDPSADGISAVTTVGALMEERRHLELWLAALVARRAQTPKHVFTRVHADYTARLESVIERLTGQVEGMRTELTTLATRIAMLDEQQHRARDERAEAELRAHVGEMTSDEWDEAARKADAAVAALARRHAEAEDALARTREFLANAERPATPAGAAPAIAARPSSPVPTAPAPPPATRAPTAIPIQTARGTTSVTIGGASPAPSQAGSAPRLRPLPGREEPPAAPAEVAARGGNFDELAFLSSVVDEGAAGAHAAPAAPTAASRVAPVARPAPPPNRNPFVQRAQDKIVNNDGAAGPQIESKRVGGRTGLAANVSGNVPIILRDKSNEASKTLKCGECGAVNYPTEWYCERCGAELASL